MIPLLVNVAAILVLFAVIVAAHVAGFCMGVRAMRRKLAGKLYADGVEVGTAREVSVEEFNASAGPCCQCGADADAEFDREAGR